MKSRFCPSPTGHIHLGNVRAALFNKLIAKKLAGIFLLRIEDTDKARSKLEYIDSLQHDMNWLGLAWDEGPVIGGPDGPYCQSQRQAIYDKYYAQLIQQAKAYPCFCTEQQLAITRKIQLSTGKPPRYAGTCRQLTAEQLAEKRAQGLPESLRFLMPKGETIKFDDLVKGPQIFKSDDIGDFIIRRHDGTPSFMFSNAIDDALMGVTYALRGEDHLTNTPKQLLLQQALNLPSPQYGHLSLILGSDGSPLSKRNGSRSVMEVRELGYLPLAIVNYLARIGHTYEQNTFMNFAELAEKFSMQTLSLSPARFDVDHLNYWQKEAILNLSDEELLAWLKPVMTLVKPEQLSLFITTIKRNILLPQDAEVWSQLIFAPQLDYSDAAKTALAEAGSDFFDIAEQAVLNSGIDFKTFSQEIIQATGKKGKALFLPLRMALTGRDFGPEMAPLCQLMGQDQILKRFKQAGMYAKNL